MTILIYDFIKDSQVVEKYNTDKLSHIRIKNNDEEFFYVFMRSTNRKVYHSFKKKGRTVKLSKIELTALLNYIFENNY